MYLEPKRSDSPVPSPDMTSSRPVTCSDCGVSLNDPASTATDPSKPCPSCGSLARTVQVTGSASIGVTVTASVDVRAHAEVAEATARAFDATVTTARSPEVWRHQLTSMGLAAKDVSLVKWAPLTEGTWLVEVVNTNGDIKTVMCDDDGRPDALLELILYMLPPDHPDYPQD
jgi:hypothetical protein